MASVGTQISAEGEVVFDTPLHKILVAVGRRGADDPALSYAAALASKSGAAVRVLHLREREVYGGHRFSMESSEEAARVLDESLSDLRAAGVTASGSVRDALAGREGAHIVDEAANWGADAIVLGPGPRRSWRRLFGRGVRGQVLRLSAIPVIVESVSSAQQRTSHVDSESRRARERHAA